MPNLNIHGLQSSRIDLELRRLLVLIYVQNSNRLKGGKNKPHKTASHNNDSPLQNKFAVPVVPNLWFADI